MNYGGISDEVNAVPSIDFVASVVFEFSNKRSENIAYISNI